MAHTLDPTSQLWAKQIRREHGFIQKRISDLDSTSNKHEDRLKAVENAVKTSAGGEANAVAALAKQVQAIDSNGIKERLAGMEKNVNEKIGGLAADNYTMTQVVDGLQRDKQVAEEERKATLTKDKALLKRIGEVEVGLKKYEKNLDLLGKGVDGARNEQIESIKRQLDGLTKDVLEKGEGYEKLKESVSSLETANAALVKANEKLDRRLKEHEAKVANAAKKQPRCIEQPSRTPVKEAAPAEQSNSQRKKSHKWAGGGADKDIITQGADLFGFKAASTKPAPKSESTSSAPQRPVPKPVKKTPAPKKNPVPKTVSEGFSRKSHKWAGGGADRDIIAAGLTQETKRGSNKSLPDDTPTQKPQTTAKLQSTAKKFEDGKEVIRAGRGWYEVERSPTRDEEPDPLEALESRMSAKKSQEKPKRVKKPIEYSEDGTPIKRPRGRPRKYPRPDEVQSQSLTESARSSLGPPPSNPDAKKRSVDTAFELDVPDEANPLLKKSKKSSEDRSDAKTDNSIGVAPSFSLAAPRRVIYAMHDPQDGSKSVAPVARMAPSEPSRRQIVQLDDDNMETILERMQE